MKTLFSVTLAVLTACTIGGASAQETKLLVVTMSPPQSDNVTKFFGPWSERVNQASNGAITLELRHGRTLATHENVLDRVMNDVIQIGWVLHGQASGRFPRASVGSLPFIAETAEESSVALWRLYKTGLLDAEYQDVVPFLFHLQPQSQIHMVREPQSLDNFRGLKFGASTRVPLEVAERLGATPISVQPGNFYELLQRHTADGIVTAWAGNSIFKYSEVTSYHIEVSLGAATGMIFMSKAKFDSLPAAGRKALMENSGEPLSRAMGRHLDVLQNAQRELVSNMKGHTIVKLTAEQDSGWRKVVEPIIAEWAAKNPGGEQILDSYRRLVAQVRSEMSAQR
jgi:TRAP-type C4-dicarboxylate transport system substrate-binding protein